MFMRGLYNALVLTLTLLHLAQPARAQTAGFDVFSITPNTTLQAGTKFDIRWYPTPAPLDGPVSISLIHGSEGSLRAAATLLGSNITVANPEDSKWTWSVPGPADWTPADYESPIFVFRLQLDADNSTYSISLPVTISGIELLDSNGIPTATESITAITQTATSTSSPTGSQTSSSSGTANTALSATSTPTNSASGSTSSSSSGLSSGAKAGIAVGAVVIVAIIAALVFLLIRQRRKARYQTQTQTQSPAASLPPDSEPATATTATTALSPDTWLMDFANDAAEKDTVWREGVGQNGMHELDASKQSELPAEADSSPVVKKDAVGNPIPAVTVSTPETAGINDIHPLPGIGYDSSDPASDLADLESDKKLDVLQTRLEKVRTAKEKLKNLPELEELERELQEEVMKEHRRKLSNASAGG